MKQSGRAEVKVVGLSLPNLCKPRVRAGDALKRGDTSLAAGRLGTVQVIGDNVMLGAPFILNASNIDKFDL